VAGGGGGGLRRRWPASVGFEEREREIERESDGGESAGDKKKRGGERRREIDRWVPVRVLGMKERYKG
jgi:hypothetical protein